jgi:alkylation response protein AidB-like acyl-CoA dehydrogenase
MNIAWWHRFRHAQRAERCRFRAGVAAKALQVHGGYGYTQDFAVERLLRDAISPRAATGVTHAATGA